MNVEKKECFGQLANMTIRFRDSLKQHYLRVDDEKIRECDQCPLFTKCMFLRYNELMREMLKMIDDNANKGSGTASLRLS